MLYGMPSIKKLTLWSDPLTLCEPKLVKPHNDNEVTDKTHLFAEPYICYGKLVKAIRMCPVLVRLGLSSNLSPENYRGNL